jgi:hypothetical protein
LLVQAHARYASLVLVVLNARVVIGYQMDIVVIRGAHLVHTQSATVVKMVSFIKTMLVLIALILAVHVKMVSV